MRVSLSLTTRKLARCEITLQATLRHRTDYIAVLLDTISRYMRAQPCLLLDTTHTRTHTQWHNSAPEGGCCVRPASLSAHHLASAVSPFGLLGQCMHNQDAARWCMQCAGEPSLLREGMVWPRLDRPGNYTHKHIERYKTRLNRPGHIATH